MSVIAEIRDYHRRGVARFVALRVACPNCGAAAGSPCKGKRKTGNERKRPHIERFRLAATTQTVRARAPSRKKHDSNYAPHEWQKVRARVFALKGSQCVYCGADASHVDHATPLSRGGTDEIENLVPSCAPCNIAKGTRTAEEFRQ